MPVPTGDFLPNHQSFNATGTPPQPGQMGYPPPWVPPALQALDSAMHPTQEAACETAPSTPRPASRAQAERGTPAPNPALALAPQAKVDERTAKPCKACLLGQCKRHGQEQGGQCNQAHHGLDESDVEKG